MAVILDDGRIIGGQGMSSRRVNTNFPDIDLDIDNMSEAEREAYRRHAEMEYERRMHDRRYLDPMERFHRDVQDVMERHSEMIRRMAEEIHAMKSVITEQSTEIDELKARLDEEDYYEEESSPKAA